MLCKFCSHHQALHYIKAVYPDSQCSVYLPMCLTCHEDNVEQDRDGYQLFPMPVRDAEDTLGGPESPQGGPSTGPGLPGF